MPHFSHRLCKLFQPENPLSDQVFMLHPPSPLPLAHPLSLIVTWGKGCHSICQQQLGSRIFATLTSSLCTLWSLILESVPGQTTECNLGQFVKQRIQKKAMHLRKCIRESTELAEWDQSNGFQAMGLMPMLAVHNARALWLGSKLSGR